MRDSIISVGNRHIMCTQRLPTLMFSLIIICVVLCCCAKQSHWKQMIKSAESGDNKAVVALLETGIDVNLKDPDGFTPLHAAVSQKRIDTVHLLIANGADVNAKTKNGVTPLHIAASLWPAEMHECPDDARDVICQLILAGADLRAKGPLEKNLWDRAFAKRWKELEGVCETASPPSIYVRQVFGIGEEPKKAKKVSECQLQTVGHLNPSLSKALDFIRLLSENAEIPVKMRWPTWGKGWPNKMLTFLSIQPSKWQVDRVAIIDAIRTWRRNIMKTFQRYNDLPLRIREKLQPEIAQIANNLKNKHSFSYVSALKHDRLLFDKNTMISKEAKIWATLAVADDPTDVVFSAKVVDELIGLFDRVACLVADFPPVRPFMADVSVTGTFGILKLFQRDGWFEKFSDTEIIVASFVYDPLCYSFYSLAALSGCNHDISCLFRMPKSVSLEKTLKEPSNKYFEKRPSLESMLCWWATLSAWHTEGLKPRTMIQTMHLFAEPLYSALKNCGAADCRAAFFPKLREAFSTEAIALQLFAAYTYRSWLLPRDGLWFHSPNDCDGIDLLNTLTALVEKIIGARACFAPRPFLTVFASLSDCQFRPEPCGLREHAVAGRKTSVLKGILKFDTEELLRKGVIADSLFDGNVDYTNPLHVEKLIYYACYEIRCGKYEFNGSGKELMKLNSTLLKDVENFLGVPFSWEQDRETLFYWSYAAFNIGIPEVQRILGFLSDRKLQAQIAAAACRKAEFSANDLRNVRITDAGEYPLSHGQNPLSLLAYYCKENIMDKSEAVSTVNELVALDRQGRLEKRRAHYDCKEYYWDKRFLLKQ